jgi:hypothetical protein
MNFAGKWIELEDIILSEATQIQKDRHGMHSLISGSCPWDGSEVGAVIDWPFLQSLWHLGPCISCRQDTFWVKGFVGGLILIPPLGVTLYWWELIFPLLVVSRAHSFLARGGSPCLLTHLSTGTHPIWLGPVKSLWMLPVSGVTGEPVLLCLGVIHYLCQMCNW